MREARSPHHHEYRLAAYVAIGAIAGCIYIIFDILSETKIEHGTLTGPLAGAHAIIDHTFPALVGALLGVCVHYLRLRGQLAAAEEAASRAEALRTRLQKVERDQAAWVLAAAVLHELNNPLHALGLLLDELALAADDDATRTDLIERARAQTDRALSHLELLRTMPTTGEPEFAAIPLDQVIEGLASDVGALAAEDGIAVRVACAGQVYAKADATYVRTILENLVDNSLHALRGQSGSVIAIRVAVEGGCAVVCVGDDGPPLDAQVRGTLFEPLRTTKPHGLGLGLPIARALARAMHGELTFDDAHGKMFRLTLPLLEPTARALPLLARPVAEGP